MKMLLEKSYRRNEKFIYVREELLKFYKSDSLDLVLKQIPFIVNINFERFVFYKFYASKRHA